MLGAGVRTDESACRCCTCKPLGAPRRPHASREGLRYSPTAMVHGKEKVHACIYCGVNGEQKIRKPCHHALYRKLSKASVENEIKRKHEKRSNHNRKEIPEKLYEMDLPNGNSLCLKLINFGNLPKVIKTAYKEVNRYEETQEQNSIGKIKHILWFKRVKKEFRAVKKIDYDLKEGAPSDISHSNPTYFIYRPNSPTRSNKQTSTGLIPLHPKKGSETRHIRDRLKQTMRRSTPYPLNINEKINSSQLFKTESEKYVLVQGQDRYMQTSMESISYPIPRSSVHLLSDLIQIKVKEGYSVTATQDLNKQSSERSVSFQSFKTECEKENLAAKIRNLKKRARGRSSSYPPTANKFRKKRSMQNITHPLIATEIQTSKEVIAIEAKEVLITPYIQHGSVQTKPQKLCSSTTRDKQTNTEPFQLEAKKGTVTSHSHDRLSCQCVNCPLKTNGKLRSFPFFKMVHEEGNLVAKIQNLRKRGMSRSLSHPSMEYKLYKQRSMRNINHPLKSEIQTSNEVISTEAKEIILEVSAQIRIKPELIEMEQNKERETGRTTIRSSKGISHYSRTNTESQTSTECIPGKSKEVNLAPGPKDAPKLSGESISNSAISDVLRTSDFFQMKSDEGHSVTSTQDQTKGTRERSLSPKTAPSNRKGTIDVVQIDHEEKNDVISSQDLNTKSSLRDEPHSQIVNDTEPPNVYFFTEHKDVMFPPDTQDQPQQTSEENYSENHDICEGSVFFLVSNDVLHPTDCTLCEEEHEGVTTQDRTKLSSEQCTIHPIKIINFETSTEFILTDQKDVWATITGKTSAEHIHADREGRPNKTTTQDLTRQIGEGKIPYAQISKETQTSTEFNTTNSKEVTLAATVQNQKNQIHERNISCPPTTNKTPSTDFLQVQREEGSYVTNTKSLIKQSAGLILPQNIKTKNTQTSVSKDFTVTDTMERKLDKKCCSKCCRATKSLSHQPASNGKKPSFESIVVRREMVHDMKTVHDLTKRNSDRNITYIPLEPITKGIQTSNEFTVTEKKEVALEASTHDPAKSNTMENISYPPITEGTQTSTDFTTIDRKEVTMAARAQDETKRASMGRTLYHPQISNIKTTSERIQIKLIQGHEETTTLDKTNQSDERNQINQPKTSGKLTSNESTLPERKVTTSGVNARALTKSTRIDKVSYPPRVSGMGTSSQYDKIKLGVGHYVTTARDETNQTSEGNKIYPPSSKKLPHNELIQQKHYQGHEITKCSGKNNILYPPITKGTQTSTEFPIAGSKEVTIAAGSQDQIKGYSKKTISNVPTKSHKLTSTELIHKKQAEGNDATKTKNPTKQTREDHKSFTTVTKQTQTSEEFTAIDNNKVTTMASPLVQMGRVPDPSAASYKALSIDFIRMKRERSHNELNSQDIIKRTPESSNPYLPLTKERKIDRPDSEEFILTASIQEQRMRTNVGKTPFSAGTSSLACSERMELLLEHEHHVTTMRGLPKDISEENLFYQEPYTGIQPSNDFIQIYPNEGHEVTPTRVLSKKTNKENIYPITKGTQTSTEFILTDCKEITLPRQVNKLQQGHGIPIPDITKQKSEGRLLYQPTSSSIPSSHELSQMTREEGHEIRIVQDAIKRTSDTIKPRNEKNKSHSLKNTETRASDQFMVTEHEEAKGTPEITKQTYEDITLNVPITEESQSSTGFAITDSKEINPQEQAKRNRAEELYDTPSINSILNSSEENVVRNFGRGKELTFEENKTFVHMTNAQLPSHKFNEVKFDEERYINTIRDHIEQTSDESISYPSISGVQKTQGKFLQLESEGKYVAASIPANAKRTDKGTVPYEPTTSDKLSQSKVIRVKLEEGRDLKTIQDDNRQSGEVYPPSIGSVPSTALIQVNTEGNHVATSTQDLSKDTNEEKRSYQVKSIGKRPSVEVIQEKNGEGHVSRSSQYRPDGSKVEDTTAVELSGSSANKSKSSEITNAKRTDKGTVPYESTTSDKLSQSKVIRVKFEEGRDLKTIQDGNRQSGEVYPPSIGSVPSTALIQVNTEGNHVATSTLDLSKDTNEEKISYQVKSIGKRPSVEVIQEKNGEGHVSRSSLYRTDGSKVEDTTAVELSGPSANKSKSSEITNIQTKLNPHARTSLKPCPYEEQFLKRRSKKSGISKERIARRSNKNQIQINETKHQKIGNKITNHKSKLERNNVTGKLGAGSPRRVSQRKNNYRKKGSWRGEVQSPMRTHIDSQGLCIDSEWTRSQHHLSPREDSKYPEPRRPTATDLQNFSSESSDDEELSMYPLLLKRFRSLFSIEADRSTISSNESL